MQTDDTDNLSSVIGPRQTVMITTRESETEYSRKDRIFPTDYHTLTGTSPLTYCIILPKDKRITTSIIRSGCFCVNFLSRRFEHAVSEIAKQSDEYNDAFFSLGIRKEECNMIECSRISGASAFLECEVEKHEETENTMIISGKVLKAEYSVSGILPRLFHLKGDEFLSVIAGNEDKRKDIKEII